MTTTAAEMVGAANAQIGHVSPKEASDEVASGKAVLLDVREPVQWEQHIAGSVQVPRGLLEFVADPASPKHNAALDPAGRVIVYCGSAREARSRGSRSRHWVTSTLPTSTAGSQPGKKPAYQPTNTTLTSRGRLAVTAATIAAAGVADPGCCGDSSCIVRPRVCNDDDWRAAGSRNSENGARCRGRTSLSAFTQMPTRSRQVTTSS